MPRYKEIAIALKKKIVEGDFNEGELLPDQESLAKIYNTSRVTVRKAIQLLIDEGLLYTRRGSGTYVRTNIKKNITDVTQMNSVFGTSIQEGVEVTSKILRFEVRFPTDYEFETLKIKPTDPVYDIKRVRYVKEEARSIETSIMPLKYIKDLDENILKGSIYNYIREKLGYVISAAQRVIIASKANELDSEEFGIEVGDPILETNQVVFFDDGTPFDLSKTRYPYTSGKIVADIN
ncbi:GntR family transcriptional regulator [Enterococcus durans]|uniref:GntR family transcriptional regulator n=1 Tax=Enterococcus TaxID=1350 RepID=UPI00188285D3|nr:GntR family transcriptional regulator [Enterococcus durans]MBE8848142.1 GntR family transcriptional regulator [Enterococcus durans]MDB1654090.1 GntR family transcriptional regulator [Enterococcus durans]MDB1654434.1 GntR family transcriptional regulator [Enterococcus durans]MDB1664052.1 GntR family transcriptional regulator [Enterococcus durans]MDB1668384.1 GntR family transcriptional regulator [Enterococcus durans]